MRAAAEVVVEERDGRLAFPVLRSEPPILLRPTASALILQAGAAGPVGGDDLSLKIVLTEGVSIAMTTVGATVVLPGTSESRFRIDITIGRNSTLHWDPHPLISVIESDHHQQMTIEIAPGGTLSLLETIVLGRSNEPPGHLRNTLRVTASGLPILHQNLDLGGDGAGCGWSGPAVTAGHRVLTTALDIGPKVSPRTEASIVEELARGLRTPLRNDAELTQTLGHDVPSSHALAHRLRAKSEHKDQ